MRVVKKYGGSSVATTEKIKNIARHIADAKKNSINILSKNPDKNSSEKNMQEFGDEIVVVVSAMGKTTDTLIKLANEISCTPDIREMDVLLSIGEQQTISLLSMALKEFGCSAISLTGSQAGIKTIGHHTKSKIEMIDTSRIEKYLQEGNVVIVAGFQGVNANGDITTLGRGGSDTTAVALAASLGCECEIYTDVDGIYGVDPRVYPTAKKLPMISYEEMMEMSHLGAGVMETRAVEIGQKYGVKIYVGESLKPKTGTYICDKNSIIEEKAITGISINKNIIMVEIENFESSIKNVSKLFSLISYFGVRADMISQTEIKNGNGAVAFTCPTNDEGFFDEMSSTIKKQFPDILIRKRKDVAKISVVGIGLISHFEIVSQIFLTLAEINVELEHCTTSETSISLIVPEKSVPNLVEKLAQNFKL
ncbi:MAG: aspartate kinase [Fusobacteriaceae bacterium]